MTAGAAAILLVEPYFGGSHRAWAEGVALHSGHRVELLTLPARWWKWRMRGAAVTMAEQCAGLDHRPQAILVSDMIDLAAFRTFARPHLGDVPTAVYFHETQLTYPDSPQMEPDLHYAVINWLSALAADRVFFNSAYHRDTFFAELPRLLRHFPEDTHEHRIVEVREKSEVLEVGVDLAWADSSPERDGPIRLVWNHRWEHDKDPESFFSALEELDELEFELVVCGETFGNRPPAFARAAERHEDRIVHFGHAAPDNYRALLQSADVVVSTARQEFFGMAVVEAMAAGCMPVLPKRLSYPELVPEEWHDRCLYPDGSLVDRLAWAVQHPDETRWIGDAVAPAVARYAWPVMGPRYRSALGRLAGQELA